MLERCRDSATGQRALQVIQARSSITTSASLILIWSGSTLFSIVARILDTIWSKRDIRSGVRYRGLALLFVGGLSIVILPFLFIGSWITPLVKDLLPNMPAFLYLDVGIVFSILVSIAFFGLLYRFLPHARPRWGDIWIDTGSYPVSLLFTY